MHTTDRPIFFNATCTSSWHEGPGELFYPVNMEQVTRAVLILGACRGLGRRTMDRRKYLLIAPHPDEGPGLSDLSHKIELIVLLELRRGYAPAEI